MERKKYFLAFIVTAILAVITTLYSCKKDSDKYSDAGPSGKSVDMAIHLTDGPADYDAVYIDIQQVEVTMDGSPAVILVPLRPGIYDLLRFRNGLDTLLLRADVPPGRVQQMRLILGNNNSVVVDGQVHALTTPSAQESGLKLNLHEDFVAGGAYDIWIDFDAGKSIHKTGNGKYMLKPVIRAYSSVTDGRIKGYVLPLAAGATVYVTDGVNIYSAIPAPDGFFQFTGLPSGAYDVTFDAALASYNDVTISDVKVSYGATANLGTTLLQP